MLSYIIETHSISESCLFVILFFSFFSQHVLRNNPPVQFRLTHMAQAHATLPAFVPHLVDQTGETQLWLVHHLCVPCIQMWAQCRTYFIIYFIVHYTAYVLAYLFWSDCILHTLFYILHIVYYIIYLSGQNTLYCVFNCIFYCTFIIVYFLK